MDQSHEVVPMTTSERRAVLNKAFLAEDAGRLQDTVDNIMKIAKSVPAMTLDERNLLATAFKNYIGEKRTSWRTIVNIEANFDSINRKRDLCKDYRIKIEDELKKDCHDVIEIVDRHLAHSNDLENQMFYLKMKGDYFRYLAEFSCDTPGDPVFQNARAAYIKGLDIAKEHLPASHPLRLGIILNFSVFHHEILKQYEKACEMTKEGVQLGEEDLQHSHHHVTNKKDSEIILQLLKDNLRVWSADMDSQNSAQ